MLRIVQTRMSQVMDSGSHRNVANKVEAVK